MLRNAVSRHPELLEGAPVEPLKQFADGFVQLRQAEETPVAQAGQYPAFDDEHTVLDLRLVARFSGACRDHRHAVMVGEIQIGWIGVGLIPTRLADTAFEVVRHEDFGGSAEVFQHTDMAAYPVRNGLAPCGFSIGVVGSAHDAHEDLRLADFAGVPAGDGHGVPRIIHEAFLAR